LPDFLRSVIDGHHDIDFCKTSGQLADYLRCQVAFISQVLSGSPHLSLEHAIQTTHFLEMGVEETEFFMILVHSGRAGSHELKKYYAKQISQIKERRQKISERIEVKSNLDLESQTTYYSSWIYAAAHILLSVAEFQSPNRIAEHLRLPLVLINETIEFLVSVGLAEKKKEKYIIGTARIHLPAASPLISKHHISWRMQAIQSLEGRGPESLHYSLVMSLLNQMWIK